MKTFKFIFNNWDKQKFVWKTKKIYFILFYKNGDIRPDVRALSPGPRWNDKLMCKKDNAHES